MYEYRTGGKDTVDVKTNLIEAWARAFLTATYGLNLKTTEDYHRICEILYGQEVPHAFSDQTIDYSMGELNTLNTIFTKAEKYAGVVSIEHLVECTELDNEVAWLQALCGLVQLPQWATVFLASGDLEAYHAELHRRRSLPVAVH